MKMKSFVLHAIILLFFFAVPLCAQTVPAGPSGTTGPVAPAPLAAPPEYTPLSFADEPLSYAVYHDTRAGANAYIGLMYPGGNKLVIRVYESDSGTVLLASQTFYTTTAIASGVTGVSGMTADKPAPEVEPGTIALLSGDFGATPYGEKIFSEVYGWIDAWLHSRARFEEASVYDFDETCRYKFEYWIPILQMRSAEDVKLVSAGVLTSMTDPAFFSFDSEVKTANGPSYAITVGKSAPSQIGALQVSLDSNWVRGDDGIYRISHESPQDAFCQVETLDMSEFGSSDTFDLIKLFILHSGGILLPEDLRIFVSGGYPCLFYRVCDPVTRMVTAQFRVFIPKDETHLSVLSFGAFASLYDANKEYFDYIFL